VCYTGPTKLEGRTAQFKFCTEPAIRAVHVA